MQRMRYVLKRTLVGKGSLLCPHNSIALRQPVKIGTGRDENQVSYFIWLKHNVGPKSDLAMGVEAALSEPPLSIMELVPPLPQRTNA